MKFFANCIVVLSAAVTTTSAAPAAPPTVLAPRGHFGRFQCGTLGATACLKKFMNYADPTDQTVPIKYWRQEAEWAFMELRETFIMSKTKLFKGRGGFEKAYEGFKEQVKPWLARRDRDHLGALVVTESENWALRFFGLHLAYFMEHMVTLDQSKRAELYTRYAVLASMVSSHIEGAQPIPEEQSCKAVLGYIERLAVDFDDVILIKDFAAPAEAIHKFLYRNRDPEYQTPAGYFGLSLLPEEEEAEDMSQRKG